MFYLVFGIVEMNLEIVSHHNKLVHCSELLHRS
jgi:hypothetical protein